jgi:transposase-like protein
MRSLPKQDDPRYRPEPRARAAALYEEHGTVAAVAEAMGVAQSRAWVYLRDAGVQMKRGRKPHNRKEAA